MAKMNGCNADMVTGPIGSKGTRVNPAKAGRANMSKGGVNDHLGGTTEPAPKMDLKAGQNGMGKYRHDKS